MYIFDLLPPTGQEIVTERLKHASAELHLRAMSASQSKPASFDMWHRRMDHNGWDALRRTPGVVDGMEIVGAHSHDSDVVCESCMAGRQARRPFDEEVVREMELGERIHVDLAGPLAVRSLGGKYYVMDMTDGCSQYLDSGFLTEKLSAETAQAMEQFIEWFERETGKKVKCVQSDGGKEFLGEFSAMLKARGIRHETTAPYSPSQNGIFERANRTVFDHARAMMHDGGVPRSLWA